MPTDATMVNRDTIKKIHVAEETTSPRDAIRKLASLERVQPGGILGATVQPGLVPFGLERDDEEPV